MLFTHVLAAAVTLAPPRVPAGPPCLVIRHAPEGACLVHQAPTLRDGLTLMARWVDRYPECRVLVRAGDRLVADHLP